MRGAISNLQGFVGIIYARAACEKNPPKMLSLFGIALVTDGSSDFTTVHVNVERLRLASYSGFILQVVLCAVVFLVTKPVPYKDANPMIATFGYPNVCLFWDFRPSSYIAPVFWALVAGFIEVYLLLLRLKSTAEA